MKGRFALIEIGDITEAVERVSCPLTLYVSTDTI